MWSSHVVFVAVTYLLAAVVALDFKSTSYDGICEDRAPICTNGHYLESVCKETKSATDLCPKSCGICGSITTPPTKPPTSVPASTAAISTPLSGCADDPLARCEGDVLSLVCSIPNTANSLCKRSCGLCPLHGQNATGTMTKITALPGGTTMMQGSSTTKPYSWGPWNIWSNCQAINRGCYKTRYRTCPSGQCHEGRSYDIMVCTCEDSTPGTPPSTTESLAVTVSGSSSSTPKALNACQDDPTVDCSNLNVRHLICNNPPSAAALCPMTCGLCGTCYDYLNCSSPSARALFCSDDTFARQLCRKTCNRCDEPPISVQVNECFDPVSTVQACVSLHESVCICKDPVLRDMCKNYCDGRCVGYAMPRDDCTAT